MEIHTAIKEDYPMVRAFYHSLIEGMQNSEFDIGWKEDIYPSPDFLKDSIANGDLFIGTEENKIVAAMVLNHECNDGYQEFEWPTKTEHSEVTIIHALGVHPQKKGKGYAKQMVDKAFEVAKRNHQKAIRLDVLEGNLPAEKLYTGLGFQYMHTLKMFYEDTGWTNYKLYEYAL
ncbi:N-acetyltransferase [Ligaoa zhengdingensis]|uniref:GNAT family N-acetyltransferase n=1 Tax=Ligaoa zhengdingensis TaxID=2763658 RepID=UPI0031B9D8D3